MRKLLPILAFTFFAACEQKIKSEIRVDEPATPENIIENLRFTVDTVVVDAKGELLNPDQNIYTHDISPDKTTLFLFDQKRTVLWDINLDKMELIASHQFEAEGPNGVGWVIFEFEALSNNQLLISGDTYNLAGERQKSFDFEMEDLSGSENIDPIVGLVQMTTNSAQDKIFGITGRFGSGRVLAVVNAESQKGKLIKLPKMEKAKNFTITQNSGNGGGLFGEFYHLNNIKGKLYISCSVGSGMYIYDPAIDSLQYLDFPHKVIETEKSVEIKNNVSSSRELWDEHRKAAAEISFWKIFWDDKTSKFYRLASKSKLGETERDKSSHEVYLLVYDSDLKLIGESLIEGYNEYPRNYFFKDGKLYSYVNVKDELGFVVFTFDF